jgi:DNA-directed RNA polymerase subunit E'/Rpb7
MEQIAVFEEKISLSALDLRAEINSFDEILLNKLRTKMEGKCSQHGYIIPNSLKLLSRSLGYAEKGRFTADFMYQVKAQGRVYNPPDGVVVEGEVIRKNKMGLYVILNDAIRIMIPRDLHIGDEEFDRVEMGETIRVEIKKSQFQVNDSHILSVGRFIGSNGVEVEVEKENENEDSVVQSDSDAEDEDNSEQQQEEE